MKANKDIWTGIGVAFVLHCVVLFSTMPIKTPSYEVIVAPSVLEISLVATPRKKIQKNPEPPVIQKDPLEQIEEPKLEPEPQPEVVEEVKPEPEVVEEPVEDIQEEEAEIVETNAKQGVTIDVKPIVQRNRPPTYPRSARRKKWEGRVILNVLVSKKGAVKTVNILQSSGYQILDDEAVKGIKQWVFEPAQLFGRLIEKHIEIPVVFRLE